jgi:acetylornithine deacetylase/succinyl-diaminopimelate desuccinylase-like protein
MRELAAKVFVPGCTTDLTVPTRGRIAMVLTEKNQRLAERLNQIFEDNGMERLSPIRSKGGSDAADVTEAGIPCLDNFGTVGGWVHSTKEYGRLDSLAPAARRLALAALYL